MKSAEHPISDDESDSESPNKDRSDSNPLIQPLGRDITINCLLRLPRSDYGVVASLNRCFRSLVRSGELYKLRRWAGISEQWVYISCSPLEWEAFDPDSRRWMRLPRMPPNDCFMLSDKESIAIGTDLLVFGKEVMSHAIMRYSILTNSWSYCTPMKTPRCLFGAASFGQIAIFAGGVNAQGIVLSCVELYNSETGTWMTLPSMNKPRKSCSGTFLNGKFYIMGGIGSNSVSYTCGEEYDLEKRSWRIIPDVYPVPCVPTVPPLAIAVVNNELYAADHAPRELRKYDKQKKRWIILGRLPEGLVSTNGWGIGFRGCGKRLVVVGGVKGKRGSGTVEIYSWDPVDGVPRWELLASRPLGSFVYNCTVMDC
ncbi:F-box/kelch-repeat protein SKIP11-like [Magnolia sinica]|uniref:F-box/kelch-repeat protein SKIP11-like n=1 Tax=Magnolia sinica TaxID=86752 RepID=UPI00265B42ED|nr:F-box/kelch-repeat protein SKIP11-like [Magnolia sinica]